MQLTNKITKQAALGLITLASSFTTMAASEVLTGSFTTIKDASIIQVLGNEMVFNGLLMTQTTGTCDMPVPSSGAGYPGDTIMKLANVATSNAANSPGVIGAVTNACVGGTGVVGIYEIDGSPGTSVIVTVTGVTTGSVGYVPAGCVGNYVTGANGDSCLALTVSGSNASQTFRLADSTDLTNSAGEGVPEAGKSRLALGGTVTALVGLAAATEYPVDFDISVTY